jgi:uncharacterized membrane protein (UPF0127 family)
MTRLLLLTAFCLTIAQAAAQAPSPLPAVDLTAGMHRIRAEVADNMAARMQGLMHRKSMAQNAGMVFVFEENAVHCMWMKNTLIPLSVAFIDEQGAIVNIADMQPHSEQSHCAARPTRYALEMNLGWFAQRGIKAGTTLQGLPKLPPR